MNIHIRELQLNRSHILDEIQLLAKTFNLDPHNVTFKPVYYDIISIILINL